MDKKDIFLYGKIKIRGARENNLKNVDLELPKERLIVFSGPSGSGKSTLAFDTIYTEGQRRYVESLSPYARQFLGFSEKPDVDFIEGLAPSVAINQKTVPKNPRSTVGTITEIYDYLRLLYARVGTPTCPECGIEIGSQTISEIVEEILKFPKNSRLVFLAPIITNKKGEHKAELSKAREGGFARVRIDGKIIELRGDEILLDKDQKHDIEIVVDRIVIPDEISESFRERVADSTEVSLKLGNGILKILDFDKNSEKLFSERLSCPVHNISIPDLTPASFSFNSPQGACSECHGIGVKLDVDPDLVIPNRDLSIEEGAIEPWNSTNTRLSWYMNLIEMVAERHKFSTKVPFSTLSNEVVDMILNGTGDEEYSIEHEGSAFSGTYKTKFEGVIVNLERRYKETTSDYVRFEIEKYMKPNKCKSCEGKRLRKEVLAVKIDGKSIDEIVDISIDKLFPIFSKMKFKSNTKEEISKPILKEIVRRLDYLISVGLPYLTLGRSSQTLSGGEAQRIRLASQVGTGLSGVIYVLDEPSIGLHSRDTQKLIETIENLRDAGNTVIVVEHDKETIEKADWVVDFGPKAGDMGGEVVFEGTVNEMFESEKSLTGQYLSGKKEIPVPTSRREYDSNNVIEIVGATENNLQNINVKFPIGLLTVVTGVSGSGKSSLVNDILSKAVIKKFYRTNDDPGKHSKILGLNKIDKAVVIDQSPIGRTPRSNPATYTGIFSFIRKIFSETPSAKARGYNAGRFSFNVKGGRCENCKGEGQIAVEMQFLPTVYVNCEVCNGHRYNHEALEILFKGKNIAEVLNMRIEEASKFFASIPILKRKLETLVKVGLGYLKLDQSAVTLSGGEAQRIKLATELSKQSTGKTLFILDEPTTGLHFDDIRKLLAILHRLVDSGNTVVVIEHDMDVIKTADWVIDLGPEGGVGGGKIIATGTPEEIAKVEEGYTGKFLRKYV
ncbi:MAG: excinuclease ABC subunit UvrA [Patescibacteria group bacterium]